MKKKITKKKIKTTVLDSSNVQSVVDQINELPYSASIKVLGKTYEAKGATISEAIAGLKVQNCKGKAILTIQHGDVKKDKVLMPMQAFRLFSASKLMREIALKQVSYLFSGI